MKTLLLVFLLVLATPFFTKADAWSPDGRLLDVICQIESSGGLQVYGDQGRSLGPFQMQKAAWSDVSTWRQKRNLETHDYHTGVLDPQISRMYAGCYLTIIRDRLFNLYRREPLPSEIYAAYNMGMGNFRKCNYDLSQINKITAAKCRQLAEMLK